MKKAIAIIVLSVLTNNLAQGESLLPKCEGSDEKISSFSVKHFRMVRKWTNCQGTVVGVKGEKYVGEFYKGTFHGHGSFSHDGRKYVGQYKNHKKHGKGTYTYANGDKYIGEWKKAKYDGQGTYTYANGDKYIGEWKNGLHHGQGTFTHASGRVEDGIWKRNKLLKPKQ